MVWSAVASSVAEATEQDGVDTLGRPGQEVGFAVRIDIPAPSSYPLALAHPVPSTVVFDSSQTVRPGNAGSP